MDKGKGNQFDRESESLMEKVRCVTVFLVCRCSCKKGVEVRDPLYSLMPRFCKDGWGPAAGLVSRILHD